jgi:hypothetical protein
LPSFAANLSEEDKAERPGLIYERWMTAISAAMIEICKDGDFREAICAAASSIVFVGLPVSGEEKEKMWQLSFENKVLVIKFDCYYFFQYPEDVKSTFEAFFGKNL